MAFKYSEIDDPVYKATCQQREQQDYVLVEPTDIGLIPVTLPNWRPEPCCLNKRYEAYAERIKNLDVLQDDVWLVSYPKSGTTWCQEMVWLICNDLDYEKAASTKLVKRFPFMEIKGLRDLPASIDPFLDVLSMPSPRFIKTHLPVGLLPDQIWTVKPKLVYIRRNPKAVAVSYYHHSVSLHNYRGTMDEFMDSFMKELEYYSPYHNHVIEYHNLQYDDNLLHLCYEDMKTDLKGTLQKVCAYFNKSYSQEQLDTLEKHLSFESMKDNAAVNGREWVEFQLKVTDREEKLSDSNYQFIRRGESEGWRAELDNETVRRLDEWTDRNVTNSEQAKLFEYN